MNRLKLEAALTRKQRTLRPLLISAVLATISALIFVIIAHARSEIIAVNVLIIVLAAFQWSNYVSLLSSISILKVILDATVEPSPEVAQR